MNHKERTRRGGRTKVAPPGLPTLSEDRARLWVKQALVLPALGQAAEAEACARRACRPGAADGELRIAAMAALAWLLWRRHSPELAEWIEACRAEIRNSKLVLSRAEESAIRNPQSAPWLGQVSASLADFAGDWAEAREAYLELGRPPGAALVDCHQGDRCIEQGDVEGAQKLYGQAAEIWEAEDDNWGLALARCRQAEAHWRAAETDLAAASLRAALELLEPGGEAAREDRQVVQTALAALEAGSRYREPSRSSSRSPWPSWRGQRYDDAFRISILFRP